MNLIEHYKYVPKYHSDDGSSVLEETFEKVDPYIVMQMQINGEKIIIKDLEHKKEFTGSLTGNLVYYTIFDMFKHKKVDAKYRIDNGWGGCSLVLFDDDTYQYVVYGSGRPEIGGSYGIVQRL